MKIKFNLDHDSSLNKMIKIHNVTIVVLDECLYELQSKQKCYIMMELKFLKKMTLIRQANQKVQYFSLLVFFN